VDQHVHLGAGGVTEEEQLEERRARKVSYALTQVERGTRVLREEGHPFTEAEMTRATDALTDLGAAIEEEE
jgi:hypothetical protein